MSESGVVKFFNSVDSYGFIRQRGARQGQDVFVHRSAVADGQHLIRGDKVCFDVIEEDGRRTALRVTGGTGGGGLTFASNVDRSARRDLYGLVKKWNCKGYGFIQQEEGGSDLFFHRNDLAEEGELPPVGSRVRYDWIWDETRGSRKASKVAEAAAKPTAEEPVRNEPAPPAPAAAAEAAEVAEDPDSGEEWELVA